MSIFARRFFELTDEDTRIMSQIENRKSSRAHREFVAHLQSMTLNTDFVDAHHMYSAMVARKRFGLRPAYGMATFMLTIDEMEEFHDWERSQDYARVLALSSVRD